MKLRAKGEGGMDWIKSGGNSWYRGLAVGVEGGAWPGRRAEGLQWGGSREQRVANLALSWSVAHPWLSSLSVHSQYLKSMPLSPSPAKHC